MITEPTAPPITASPVNASFIIKPNKDGISDKWLKITNNPEKRYKTTIIGTIYDATCPIRWIPPKITIAVSMAIITP